ncbi:metal ABC transporter substrate-binding protein [Acidipropionibacterium timonense]|uniref:hypothetical protein n=1 Tax=Acidipropionibacterium timonense TaxID=2161818 RepID=UPI00102F58E3|nr:hypothetical protein [Acidipropionibacterium timonense]
MSRYLQAFTAAGCLLLAAGCGGGSSAPVSEPTIAASPPPLTSIAQVQPPLLKFAPTGRDAATISKAIDILAIPCAQRFGVDFKPDLTPNAMATDTIDLPTRYGSFDLAWIAKHGSEAPMMEHVDEGSWDPSPREAEVMTGQDADGNPALQDPGCSCDLTV